jgi:hypothetical protein
MNTAKTRRFAHTQLALVLCAGLVALTGCSDDVANPMTSQEQVGNASVSISVSKVAATGISRVELVVSASDMDEIREELTFEDDEATGVVVVPAGLRRLFTLNGYGEAGTLLYSGAENADVIADSKVRVAIVMRPVSDDGTSVLGLSGAIPELSFIQIGFASSTNWDSDLEDDGLQIDLFFKDANDNLIFWEDAVVSAEVRIYVSTGVFSEVKKYQDPVFEKSDYLLRSYSEYELLRVGYDALLPSLSAEDFREAGDEVAVDLVVEVEIRMADGSSFAARDSAAPRIPPDVVSMYGLD